VIFIKAFNLFFENFAGILKYSSAIIFEIFLTHFLFYELILFEIYLLFLYIVLL